MLPEVVTLGPGLQLGEGTIVNRISTTLAAAALIVAVLGITPLGHAAADAVRVTLFAQNAGKVGNIKASRTPVPGQILALDAKGKFPASVLPKGAAGARGERGPQGAQGIPGPAGPQGAGVSYERTIIVSPDPARRDQERPAAPQRHRGDHRQRPDPPLPRQDRARHLRPGLPAARPEAVRGRGGIG